ncbi:hypothetical protein LX64_03273 [Chitinophaga skermanii]|uniref:Carboxypeptidase-like protein n=2 Tax=Chitinophaga skermanii TaxID=331697 RepID=A0A327QEQ9_9BACT|nr:hypothetical protein LX64_03273 [Chitinophaga skermanii]
MRLLPVILLLLCSCLYAEIHAQSQVQGVVMDKTSAPIDAVSIQNLHSKKGTISGVTGTFSIDAKVGDTLLFIRMGFEPKQHIVRNLQAAMIIMAETAFTLRPVQITGKSYETDSILRRKEYGNMMTYKLPHWTRVVNIIPPAVNINNLYRVLQFQTNKKKFTFKKRLLTYEQEKYVDHNFSEDMIAARTGFRGDTLQQFIRQYRPSFQFLQDAAPYDLLNYIKVSQTKFLDSLQQVSK